MVSCTFIGNQPVQNFEAWQALFKTLQRQGRSLSSNVGARQGLGFKVTCGRHPGTTTVQGVRTLAGLSWSTSPLWLSRFSSAAPCLQDFYVQASHHSAPLPVSGGRSDSDPCPSLLQRSPLTAEKPGGMASARLPSLQGSREGQAVVISAAALASKPGLAFSGQSSDPSGGLLCCLLGTSIFARHQPGRWAAVPACLPPVAWHCSSSGLPRGLCCRIALVQTAMLHFLASNSYGRQPDNTTHQLVTCGLPAAGRHPRPSRFSQDLNTLQRVEGSAGAAEGPPPGKAAAAPLTEVSLHAARAWHNRWHAGMELSPVHD